MKNLFFLLISILLTACVDSTFNEQSADFAPPAGLKYMTIKNGREGKRIVSSRPSVTTGNLIPYFEIMEGYDGDGNVLDNSYMNFVSISNPAFSEWELSKDSVYPTDKDGNIFTGGTNVDLTQAGVITIDDGNNFSVGDYYFTIKVTTEHNGVTYSTVFDKAFQLTVEPLLPVYLLYQLKTQNLVYGDTESKTNAPLVPVGNTDVRFSLDNFMDKLSIDQTTGVVTLSPNYTYAGYDTIRPTINVTSNISEETVSFSGSLVVIVTDVEEVMPIESIYFFYPTLETTGNYPVGGDGFSVQELVRGASAKVWGRQTNSTASSFEAPPERPSVNSSAQRPLESTIHGSGGYTTPSSYWAVMTTQDLSVYKMGYELMMRYYYMPAFQLYMEDGRTPSDLEVYISTDYTGGAIQYENGDWTENGTWTRINEEIVCNRGTRNGPPWEDDFIGTPYPGDQLGPDPDGRKNLDIGTVYGRWIKCSYDITDYKDSQTFTVAFKVNTYFEGELLNNTSIPGRGGSYFLTDFHYVATETAP